MEFVRTAAEANSFFFFERERERKTAGKREEASLLLLPHESTLHPPFSPIFSFFCTTTTPAKLDRGTMMSAE